MVMDSETTSPPPPPSTDLLKCCNCSCVCNVGGSVNWQRSVKRKFDEFQKGFPNVFYDKSLSIARVEVDDECIALRETVISQQQTIQELYTELEEERNASSSAANEAMSMILRLQREKAEIQMESRQFKRFTEEKMAHDQQQLVTLDDFLYKRDQIIQALTCEVQAYKHRMLSFGLTETEVEGGKKSRLHNNPSLLVVDNVEFPPYDYYPPLRCTNFNEMQQGHHHPDVEEEDDDDVVVDLEKYAFGETPRRRQRPFGVVGGGDTREHLQNLEYRIYQMERNPSSNHLYDREFSGSRKIFEKGVIGGQSPRPRTRLDRRFSGGGDDSFGGTTVESPKAAPSFKKMNYFSQAEEEYSNLRKVDNASDLGEDMSDDRVYTIDSVHNGVSYDNGAEDKPGIGIYEDYVNTPRDSLIQVDIGDDPDVNKLYMRLQALEADKESMKQAIISMRTDKAQLVLLKEIAQQLCKDMTHERRIPPPPVRKPSLIGSFSFMSVLKWVVSFVFWRKKARRSKYMFGLSAENVGLLMLLDKGPRMRPWRCLTSVRAKK